MWSSNYQWNCQRKRLEMISLVNIFQFKWWILKSFGFFFLQFILEHWRRKQIYKKPLGTSRVGVAKVSTMFETEKSRKFWESRVLIIWDPRLSNCQNPRHLWPLNTLMSFYRLFHNLEIIVYNNTIHEITLEALKFLRICPKALFFQNKTLFSNFNGFVPITIGSLTFGDFINPTTSAEMWRT